MMRSTTYPASPRENTTQLLLLLERFVSQIIVPILLSSTVLRFSVYQSEAGILFICCSYCFFFFSFRFLFHLVFSLEIAHILNKKADLFSVIYVQLVISENKQKNAVWFQVTCGSQFSRINGSIKWKYNFNILFKNVYQITPSFSSLENVLVILQTSEVLKVGSFFVSITTD